MKRYSNLWSKICDMENLKLAHKNARKDKSHYTAVKKTDANLEERLTEIQQMLINHTYKPGMYHTSWRYDKGKWRILYKLPYHPDRVIQWAVMQQIEPCFQRVFLPSVCASLPNRGIHYTCQLLEKYMRDNPEGTKYYLQIDIKKFYPSINRDILRQLLRRLFKDKDLLSFFDILIDNFDYSDIHKLNLTAEQQKLYCNPECGVPIGSYISQYFANFYLAYFDHWLKEECKCKYIIRYMDDIVIFSNSIDFLENLVNKIEIYLQTHLQLKLKPNYILDETDKGISLLGYIHFPTYRLIAKNGIRKAKALFQSILSKIKITEHQWSAAMSRLGWLIWGKTYNFISSYFTSVFPILDTYYYTNKCTRPNRYFNSRIIYLKNYKKHHQWRCDYATI